MESTDTASKHSRTLTICGIVGIIGTAAVLISHGIGLLLLEEHNPISETISMMAIGKYGWVQDVGFNLFALGLAACGYAMFRWNAGRWLWHFSALLLVVLAVVILLISEWDYYAHVKVGETSFHVYLVYVLYFVFLTGTFLFAYELRRFGQVWSRISLGCGILWLIFCPIFMFVVPTSLDGLLERFLAMITVAWVLMISVLLIQKGRGQPTG